MEAYARRPQVQERLTSQVADQLLEPLHPRGALVVIEAEHQSYRDTEVADTNVFFRIGVQQANLRKKKERVEVDLAAHVSSIITYRLMLECRLPNMMRICVPC